MLRSFDAAAGSGAAGNPALAGAAFTYDNALAVIALTACGRQAEALRLGEALRNAALQDRAGSAGRLRNAYRAGPGAPLPNGWWDKARGQWLEDGYQLGTATGNVAWAGLALLTLAEQHRDRRFQETALLLGGWLLDHCRDKQRDGFSGGVFGDGTGERLLTWKSTEHNIDAEALFRWLARRDGDPRWQQGADSARRFLESQWEATDGHFRIGTLADGISENLATSGLDAQLWPQLLPAAAPDWRRALDYAERAHGVAGGFSFNNDRAGLWTEGTAQAALAFKAVGQGLRARALLDRVAAEISPGGYLWATPEARLGTGLAIGPDSVTADFFYFHVPHLGATAWAVIAALGWNPLTGRQL